MSALSKEIYRDPPIRRMHHATGSATRWNVGYDGRLDVLQLDSHYQSRWTGQGLIGSEEFVLAV